MVIKKAGAGGARTPDSVRAYTARGSHTALDGREGRGDNSDRARWGRAREGVWARDEQTNER